jgi:hypothetical protein
MERKTEDKRERDSIR